MAVISSAFSPPPLLRNGHLQTILPLLLPRRLAFAFEPELLDLPDGDFLHLGWLKAGHVAGPNGDSPRSGVRLGADDPRRQHAANAPRSATFPSRVAILSHGLESDLEAGYIRGMAHTLHARGWDVLAWCLRGCGPESNRLPRFYHSGETGDLRAVIERAAREHQEIALIGFSLGGNITLKYLGEPEPHSAIIAGVAISAPVDLASSAQAIDSRRLNRIYLRRFLTPLVTKVLEKAKRFPAEFDIAGIDRIRTLREFDDRFTAPLHGFRDAMDYWTRASSRPFLPAIRVPTLLLNARNDPMLAEPSFPYVEAEDNPQLFLETPRSGGHVGFMDLRGTIQPWSERRTAEFLAGVVETRPS